MGYGGYAGGSSSNDPGIIGKTASAVGTVVGGAASAAGSALSSGMSYLGWKGAQP